MIVFSRKRSQQVVIGDDVIITVVEIRGDKVRVGIEAPADIPIHRQEVYAALLREASRTAARPERPGDSQNRGH